MGHPRKFDAKRALVDAMYVFWTHGYYATSLIDLTEAMHLKRGSLALLRTECDREERFFLITTDDNRVIKMIWKMKRSEGMM